MRYELVLEFEERTLTVEAEIDASIENDGIGVYEFWGQVCNDKGNPTLEIHKVKIISAIWDNGDEIQDIKSKRRLHNLVCDALDEKEHQTAIYQNL